MERLPEVILRKVTLSNPALFYSSLTSPSNRRRIEAFKHQFQTLCHAMLSRPVRILIADEIGLGKTIQALAIARYLELQGEAKKILILVPKILREQWKQEIRRLGGKPVVITNGSEVERKLLRKATFNNAAEYFVVSIDLAKSQNHSEKFSAIDWDLLIVDEVHNVTYNTQRYNFLKSLIEKSKEDLNIVFLSATPHRGNPKDYIERLRLLDPTLTADWNALDSEKFYRRTHGVLVFRRTKKVVNDLEKREIFKKCDFNAVIVDITEEEKRFFEELDEVLFEMVKDVHMNSPVALLAVLLRKRAASSYESALKTINNIIKNQYSWASGEDVLEDQIKQIFGLGYDEMELEENSEIDDLINNIINSMIRKYSLTSGQINALKKILEIGRSIGDSKLKTLAEVLAYHLKRNEKVIVFTEFKDTLEYLRNNLPTLLEQEGIHLSEEKDISVLHGGMKSEEIEKQVEKFANNGKLLISTDVASEGLNLQVANILINYEIPWSPIKLEQRVGRIWRLNQTKETIAYTLLLNHEVDLQILESLYQKILNITDAVGTGPNVGKPVFGKRTLSGNFEYRLENVQDEETSDSPVSEFELMLSAIKRRNLDEQTKRIISTLKSLRMKIEEVVPLNTCNEIQEELNSVLLPDDMESEIVFEKLKKYISAFENSFIYDRNSIGSYLFKILTDRIHEPLLNEKCLKIAVKNESKEYRLFQVEVIDRGRKIYEYPVLIEIGGNVSPQLYRGTSLLEKLADVFSKEWFVIEWANPKEKMDIQTVKLIERSARDLQSIMDKHTDYDIKLNESLMKTDSLFRRLNTRSSEILRVEGLSDREFSVFKLLHPSILEILGLSLDSIELPPSDYEKWMERSFVPLEDILESERKAMEIVMDIEKKRLIEKYGESSDWKVEDVSLKEHYDIKVSEPEGEKYIEVKGHKPLWLSAELTAAEHRFANDNRDRYWIYIVSNLGGKKPVILKIFSPFDDEKRRIYLVHENKDIDITEIFGSTIKTKQRYVISLGQKIYRRR